MKELKEHKLFRNQLIVITIILIAVGVLMSIPDLIGFGVIFGLIALFNIYTYKENKKDYITLKNKKP